MPRPLLAIVSALTLLQAVEAGARSDAVREASGITRQGEALLVVSDEEPGAYYRVPLPEGRALAVPLEPGRVTRVDWPQARMALDLEAIGVLADGRVVVLSERLRALVAETGVVAEYDNELGEFGNRGLEGLAVQDLGDRSSRVAVLWEGGYPELGDLPEPLRSRVGRLPLRPVVWVHDVKADQSGLDIRRGQTTQVIELKVPEPAGPEPEAQRFRAPDLIWHRTADEWGFIVLLSSQNSPEQGRPEYGHRWLQRFSLSGAPVGQRLELDPVVPAHLKTANWEGLGWFEEGRSVVLVHDEPPKGVPTAVVVELPEAWTSGGAGRAGLTHVIRHDTPYYRRGPHQAQPPEGTFRAGTRASVLRDAGGYALVRAEDGTEAYVATTALEAVALPDSGGQAGGSPEPGRAPEATPSQPGVPAEPAASGQDARVATSCTAVPALFEEWKRRVAIAEMGVSPDTVPGDDVRRHAAAVRGARVAHLPNPFIRIARMNPAERAAARERVPWENGAIMVLIDRSNPVKPLVVPKDDGVWLPTDASPALLSDLAVVAAAASDGIGWAAGRPCRPASIYINTPGAVGVQQLHVHVEPTPPPGEIQATEDFYRRLADYLVGRLTQLSSSQQTR